MLQVETIEEGKKCSATADTFDLKEGWKVYKGGGVCFVAASMVLWGVSTHS